MITSDSSMNLLEPIERGRLLELRHEPGAARDRFTQHEKILRALNERCPYPVRAKLQPQREILPVLAGEGQDGKHRIGDVDALVIRDLPADPDARAGEIRAARFDFQPDLAVVDE